MNAVADYVCRTCRAPSPVRAPRRQTTAARFESLFSVHGWTVAGGVVLCPACQRVHVAPALASRPAPALPRPVLEDGTSDEQIVPPGPESCVRVLEAHDAPAASQDLVAALAASLHVFEGPGMRALAHAKARDLSVDYAPGKWRMPLEECRARAAALLTRRSA